MPKLRLAGIHDDGENLVLESADGTTYLLPIDQNLRQSIARARRVTPLRGGSNNTFGPREIQTRFRQGATVEEIAAESGWEPNRVRRYEWPIVAERANIIYTARSVMISPAPGQGGSVQSLNQHIEEVSTRFGFENAPMDWSTWQQESGQWTVSLDISLTDDVLSELPRTVMFPARWNFNPANQSIYASNEAAYFLMGRDHSHDSPIPGLTPSSAQASDEGSNHGLEKQASAHSVQVAPPQVTPVRVPQNKEQNELLDELTVRRGVRSFDPASERKLADLLERARRGSRPAGEMHEFAQDGQQDTQKSEASFGPLSLQNIESEAENLETALSDAEQAKQAVADSSGTSDNPQGEEGSLAEPSEDLVQTSQEADEGTAAELTAPAQPADELDAHEKESESEARVKPARSKRTSVPSWDDIIFGNQRK